MKQKHNPFLRTASLAASIILALGATASAATYQWTGTTSSAWSTTSNWSTATGFTAGPPVSGGHRVNINCGTVAVPTNEAVYNFPSTTLAVGGNAIRGLVVGSGTANGYAKLRISDGTISTTANTVVSGNSWADLVGNSNGTNAIFELDGGNYTSGASGLYVGLSGGTTSVFTIGSASSTATITTLTLNATTATVNLNAGTLAANSITRAGGTGNFNFNGGTLKALQNNTAFLAGMTTASVNSASTIDTNGFDVTISSALSGSGNLAKNNGGILTLTAANTYNGAIAVNAGTLALSPTSATTFSGNISGAGALTLGGTGSVTLSGTNTYLGATALNSGTLNLTGSLTSDINVATGANIGGEGVTTGSLTLNGASTVFFDPSTTGPGQSLRASSITANPGSVVKFAPAGLSAAATGIVVMEATSGTITGAIGSEFLENSRVSLSFNVGNTKLLANYTPGALVWKGNAANPTFWDTEVTANWLNTGTASPDTFVASDAVLFNDDNDLTSPIAVVIQSPVFPGSMTFENDTKDYELSGSVIGGSGSITVNAESAVTFNGIINTTGNLAIGGTGTVNLNAANTYSGTTTITSGILSLGNNSALGANTAGTTISGTGQLDIKGFNLGTEVITISGNADGSGALVNSGGQQIDAIGRLVLGADATIGGSGRWDLRNSAPSLNMGGFTLTKKGSNYIAFVGSTLANPGDILVDEGTLGIQLSTPLSGGDSHTVTVSGGATLENYQTTGVQDWKMVLNGGATFWAESSSNATQNIWSGPVSIIDGETATLKADGVTTISGVISGVGSSIEKTGGSAAILTNANTFTGSITVIGGELRIGNATTIANAASITVNAGANGGLSLDGGITTSASKPITISGGGVGGSFGALSSNSGDNTWAGNVTIGSTLTRIGINGTTPQNFTVSGVIDSGANPYGLTLRARETTNLVLSGANTYLGETMLVTTNTGSVRLAGGSNRLPVTTRLLFGASAVSGILDLNGQNQEVAGMVFLSGTANEIRSADPATLTVNNPSASMFSGALTGKVALTKSGAESLTLRGANTNSGNTTVNTGGPLVVASAIAASSQTGGVSLTSGSNIITVTSTAGLAPGQAVTVTGGTGTLPANTVILSIIDGTSLTVSNNATASGAPASIAFGALAAGRLAFSPTTNGSSNKLTGAGTATIDGSFHFNLSAAAIANGNSWTLVDVTNKTYGGAFTITSTLPVAFTEVSNVWTAVDGINTWTFNETSGVLSLAVSGSDYDTWAGPSGFNLSGGSTGDDDGDGLPNFEEYAFGLNPTSASSVNPITSQLNKSNGEFKYTRRNTTVFTTNVNYSYEYSTTLSGAWNPLTVATTPTTDSGNPTEVITVTVDPSLLTNPRLFVRVKALK